MRLMKYAARMGIGEKSSQKKALEMGCEAAALNCLKAGEQHGLPLRAAIGDVARSHGRASSPVLHRCAAAVAGPPSPTAASESGSVGS